MADEIRRMQDYTTSDINDNIDEVRTARGEYDSLDDRLDNIEGGVPSPSNPIASNCVSPMTGYSKSSSSTPGNISTDDTLNAAIGKLEKRTELNENNILSLGYADKIISNQFTWNNGYIDGYSGEIHNSTQSYFSDPITLSAGQKIVVSTKNTNIGIICSTTASTVQVGDTVTVLKKTSSTAQTETYEYTATETIKIVICVLAAEYGAYVSEKSNVPLVDFTTLSLSALQVRNLIADNGASNVSSKSFDSTSLPNGLYLVAVMNSLSASERYGVSIYAWRVSGGEVSMLTPIKEVPSAKINSVTTSGGTTTMTYDASGYHAVRVSLIG